MIYHIYREVEDEPAPICDVIEADSPIEAVTIGMNEMKQEFYTGWDDSNPLSREEYLSRVDFLIPFLYKVVDIVEVESGRSAWGVA